MSMPVLPQCFAGAMLLMASMAVAADAGMHFPEFEDQTLRDGRAIWMETCKGCHGDGTADAPRPYRYVEWEQRIKQPREVLYSHAIEGFFGPDYAMMPPRGGNPALTDAQVKLAVDYMVRLVEHFRELPAP